MNPSKLLRFLLASLFRTGIVEGGEGGGTDDEEGPGDDEQQDEDGSESEGGETDEAEDGDGDAADEGDEEGADEGEPEGDGDLVVTLGDDAEQQQEADESAAAPWVRDLRRTNRELVRKQREQEAEIARLKGAPAKPAAVVVGEKPTLEACGWDGVKLEKELDAWHERKRQADEQERAQTEAEAKNREAWQRTFDGYNTAKAKLKLPDYEDAEGTVQDALNVTQQGVLVHGLEPKQAALLTYALGKNPKQLKELAAVTDPVKFAIAVTRLEMKMKVTPKRAAAPAPERVVRSSVAGAAAVDNTLERLRKEARETGDYSKVTDHQRNQREKQQKKRA